MRESLQGFWSEAWDVFELADRGSADAQVMEIRIAGSRVSIRFASAALRQAIGRAFEHLQIPLSVDRPDLTIGVWDSMSSRLPVPTPPWPLSCLTGRGDIVGWHSASIRACFQPSCRMLSMMHVSDGRAMIWINDAEAIPRQVRCVPLLATVHWISGHLGMHVVHVGAVGHETGAALLAGDGGAGKSCTAIACACDGMSYVGDDYCILDPGPMPRAHSAFSTGKLYAQDVERLAIPAEWGGALDIETGEKTILFLNDCIPQRMAADLPLKLILLPRVGNWRSTSCEPAPKTEAMRALLGATLANLPEAGRPAVERVASIVRRLPCRYLNLGAGGRPVADVVREQIQDCQ